MPSGCNYPWTPNKWFTGSDCLPSGLTCHKIPQLPYPLNRTQFNINIIIYYKVTQTRCLLQENLPFYLTRSWHTTAAIRLEKKILVWGWSSTQSHIEGKRFSEVYWSLQREGQKKPVLNQDSVLSSNLCCERSLWRDSSELFWSRWSNMSTKI